MLIRGIFRKGGWVLAFLFLTFSSQGQREDLKFGLPLLDTAITLLPAEPINSDGSEFSPLYFRNGILFVQGKKAHPLDYEEGKVFYRLKFAPLDEDGRLQASIPFNVSETYGVHLGPAAYVDSIQTLFLSRTQTQNPSSKYSKSGAAMHIFSRIWIDSSWQGSQSLSVNDSLSNTFHPTLSNDGKLLIFSSDREAGNSNFHLYASEWIGERWSTPYLLKEVSSKANDAFPFLYNDRYLFFSSDRNGGLGDYDFYLSVRKPSGWSAPVNIGSPFNSEKDDMGIAIHPNGREGLFSSQRSGSDDIYSFISSIHLFQEELPDRRIEITAVNDASGMRLDGVKMWLFEYSESGEITNPDFFQASIVEKENIPGLTLTMNRKSAAALQDPTAKTDRNGKSTLTLRPEKPRTTLVAYKKGFGELQLPLNYFQADSTIQLRLKELTCLPLEIRAVDAQGQRVSSFDILIRNLSDAQFQEFSLPLTERICIEHNKKYEIIARRVGAIPDTFQVDPQQEDVKKVAVLFRLLSDLTEKTRDFSTTDVDDLKEGVTVELRNIYYDFDRASIRKGAEKELVRLADIMKEYLAMEIELAAHTDSRGKTSYNLELSQRRAEEARRILVREGVEEKRIQARGYGATQLKNNCKAGVNCSEEEHQENRRTEIRILKAPNQMQIEYSADGLSE